jgi:hypothetical protein
VLKKGVVFSIWRIAALSDYKNPAIRIVQEVYGHTLVLLC